MNPDPIRIERPATNSRLFAHTRRRTNGCACRSNALCAFALPVGLIK